MLIITFAQKKNHLFSASGRSGSKVHKDGHQGSTFAHKNHKSAKGSDDMTVFLCF
jgi:hypothetical protein